ncbi:MAG TPA: bifunctional biotin--[acetyl-CoA-carboxylase] ligase/biotin operon repressor BirA [Acidiferrobacterales bacterium]
MTTRIELLRILSDGNFHSGTDLGRTLGLTRAAISKAVGRLGAAGLTIHRVAGRGYRLAQPCAPLDAGRIRAALARSDIAIEVYDEIDSTSLHLLRCPADSVDRRVCLAEFQTGGRGRRGRAWMASPYQNLMLSMARRFDGGPARTAGLSLAAGVAVAHTLREYGAAGVGIKWPNDLLWQGRKLAGILVDLRGEADGPTLAVIGVGVNGALSEREAAAIDQPWVALAGITGAAVDRNRLAALLIDALAEMFERFAREGLGPFRADWERYDFYAGRRVRLEAGGEHFDGEAAGIDAQGALLLRDARGGLRAFHAGEVSLRPAP